MRELVNDDASASHLYCSLLKCSAALGSMWCQGSCKIEVQHRGLCSPPWGDEQCSPAPWPAELCRLKD